LRRVRAVFVLERIGLKDARELLAGLAKGPDTAPSARVARAGVARVARSFEIANGLLLLLVLPLFPLGAGGGAVGVVLEALPYVRRGPAGIRRDRGVGIIEDRLVGQSDERRQCHVTNLRGDPRAVPVRRAEYGVVGHERF